MNNLHPIGAIKSPYDPRDIKFASLVPVTAHVPLPRKFSLRDLMSPVTMQNYGSCEGFTGKDLKEYEEMAESGQLKLLSGRFAYAVAKSLDELPTGTEGTTTRALMKALAGYGICNEEDFPNNPCPPTHEEYIKLPTDPKIFTDALKNQISGFVICDTIEEVKQCIYSGQPVFIVINIYETFDAAGKDGWIAKPVPSYNRGQHAILAIGWDDDMHTIGGLEVKNHWDASWADEGYGFIAYNYEGNYQLFIETAAPSDQVDAGVTQGAPMNLAWPVDNPVVITQHFGDNPANYAQFGLAGHEGIDLRAHNAAPIYAIDDGKVIFTGWKNDYGNTVIIEHSWGISLYAHLSKILVSDGSTPTPISKRALLGRSGSTGNVTAEHLHLGGKINGVKNAPFKDWIDLEPYLKGSEMSNAEFYHKTGTQEYGFALPKTSPETLKDMALNLGREDIIKADGTIDFTKAKEVSGL